MIDVSGWRKRQLALDKKAENARELGLGYGCAECGADGGHALYCIACAEMFLVKKAIEQEREECAKIAEEPWQGSPKAIAEQIRARGNNE
jgi:hypothetical protein